ncbi:hypothetical protein [Hymenobacter nivis]|uniref:hypothetical protein n=1 Tax=Hymenobacter nivis TaxID=1850093 RepID=UPI0013755426|nr:hypothetical protein [Hymenobacter nivis]
MKRFLLPALLAALAAPAAQAQAVGKPKAKAPTAPAAPAQIPGPTPAGTEARANALTTNMQQNLGLSPQQTEKVRAINQRGVAAVESGRVRYRTDPRKLQGLVDAVGQSRLEALKEVLTPAQFDKYQRKREEKMGVPNVQGVQGNAAPGLGGNE